MKKRLLFISLYLFGFGLMSWGSWQDFHYAWIDRHFLEFYEKVQSNPYVITHIDSFEPPWGSAFSSMAVGAVLICIGAVFSRLSFSWLALVILGILSDLFLIGISIWIFRWQLYLAHLIPGFVFILVGIVLRVRQTKIPNTV